MLNRQPNNPTSQQISMQAAVLRPFPSVLEVRPPPQSKEETLDLIIRNLESHHRDVKSSILSQSLATISHLPTSPRLTHHAPPSTLSPTQDALLASLAHPPRTIHPTTPIPPSAPEPGKEDKLLGLVEETLRKLTEYERKSEAVVGKWKVEREKLRELKRLEVERREREGREVKEREEKERRERERVMDWTRGPVATELGGQGRQGEKELAGGYDAARDPRRRR